MIKVLDSWTASSNSRCVYVHINGVTSWADPEGGAGVQNAPLEKSHKWLGFLEILVRTVIEKQLDASVKYINDEK